MQRETRLMLTFLAGLRRPLIWGAAAAYGLIMINVSWFYVAAGFCTGSIFVRTVVRLVNRHDDPRVVRHFDAPPDDAA